MNWFLRIEYWLDSKLGYNAVIHFEDIILFLSGIFIGMLIMIALSGKVVFKLQKVKNLGGNKIKLIKFIKEDGEKTYIADPKNVGESIETLLLVIFRPAFTYKQYTLRDEKRTKVFLIIMAIVGTLLFILAFFSIATVFTHPA
ncbi:hypothetical protein FDB55_03300 [Clostridium botulinum]|uniref:hypothetical protein n=1 Tax=Clostridium botulinum TaxID=1491 RepID=UPI0006A6D8C6|nr:hypothetical protein [Clostridium botulinum]KAI3350117.1 hypothetical protein CIT18_04370 [Clostridium botulinum]KOM88937.1 hypothetical protein ACP51_04160 [Clostridium botulinum]KOR63503.1 hypothetical protein ADT22_02945 [Clostridium botulinum]MCS6111515.1 hypothetical protein [Clostridium botulinum]NFE10935.1 hypothetical protein [Clostridium botulinum]